MSVSEPASLSHTHPVTHKTNQLMGGCLVEVLDNQCRVGGAYRDNHSQLGESEGEAHIEAK